MKSSDPQSRSWLASLLRNQPTGSPGAAASWWVRHHRLAPIAGYLGCREFHRDFVTSAVAWEVLKRTKGEVLAALRELGVPAYPVKGAAYASWLYEDPGMRSMGDLDILVHPSHFAQGLQRVQELGFVLRTQKQFANTDTHHAVTLDRKGVSLDLHRHMTQAGRARIQVERMFARASEEALQPIDLAVLHLAHMVRHEFGVPMGSYVDLARLLQELPGGWRDLEAECRDARLGRSCRILKDLFGAMQREEWETRVRPYPMVRGRELLRGELLGRSRQIALKLFLCEGWPERAALIRTTLEERGLSLQSYRVSPR